MRTRSGTRKSSVGFLQVPEVLRLPLQENLEVEVEQVFYNMSLLLGQANDNANFTSTPVMSRLTLSAVMPNYNHAKYLPSAIESVLQQTRPPDEFLILDDASTDHSVGIIESYAARFPSIRFVRNERNQGVIPAHQRLFEMATGDFLYSGAADDERCPQFFEHAMAMAEIHPATGLVFGKMSIIDASGKEMGEVAVGRWQKPVSVSPAEYLREYLEVEPPLHSATAATIFRREALAEAGWFPPELGSFADTFAARAVALRYGACYVPERFCAWRKTMGSVSQTTNQDGRRLFVQSQIAARLMTSNQFRDRFPAGYVTRWQRRVKKQVLWNMLLKEQYVAGERPGFLRRNLQRLTRLPTVIALSLFQNR